MCIIAIKHDNKITQEAWEWLEECFLSNRDGAGMMWQAKGGVRISKGYMEWEEFKQAIIDLRLARKTPVVFHFRIATAGRVCGGQCHPFPITHKLRDLEKLEILTTKAGIVHNGILDIPVRKGASDTEVFIIDILSEAPVNILTHPAYLKMLSTLGSKFAILTATKVYTVGNFFAEDGWEFSNLSYAIPDWEWGAAAKADEWPNNAMCCICKVPATVADDQLDFCTSCADNMGIVGAAVQHSPHKLVKKYVRENKAVTPDYWEGS